ncbi:MAG: hypothetical protein WCH35_18030 [Comamonadaceae bacterium]
MQVIAIVGLGYVGRLADFCRGGHSSLLLGEGAATPWRSRRRRIVCRIEGLPLLMQGVTVDALGQALEVGVKLLTHRI